MALLLALIFSPVSYADESAGDASSKLTDEQSQFFEARIRPVLVEHCYECHNSQTSEAGLVLDHRAALLRGGDSGPLLDRKSPADSLLLQVVRHDIDGLEMPEGGGKLAPSIIADLTRWVEMGAPDPRDQPPSETELSAATSWEAVREKRRQWWSFQPLTRPPLPGDSSTHPVDAFVNRRLQQHSLEAVARADRQTLLHRATFALTGLPPTEEQTREFLDDNSDLAFERLVDRLLASPAFGERWARHWMDWIRYAESHGSEGDPRIENAWMYRDYLIRSLNDDVSYHQLVREHIAGDLLSQPRINKDLQLNESLIATAHWRMVFHGFAPTDALDEKVRFTDDQIDAFSKAFLGLTVSCARCHNHKFDPISQEDYYALFGILGSTRPGRSAADAPEKLSTSRDELQQLKPQIRQAVARDWLGQASELPTRLLQAARATESPTGSVLKLLRQDGQMAVEWDRQRQQVSSEREKFAVDVDGERQRWSFVPGQASDWFAHGLGIDSRPSEAGDLMVDTEPGRGIARLLPSGLISGRLSTRHSARLESPEILLDGEYDVWLQVAGSGDSAYRYVVQNYPRNGTVYPVRNLKDADWSWQRLDLAYWEGDRIHLELTAAKDAPLLTRGADRSWFGVRDVRVTPRGTELPRLDLESLQPVFEQSDPGGPSSAQEAAERIARVVTAVVKKWQQGPVTDAESRLLDELLQVGVLAGDPTQLPSAAPLIRQYQQLEAAIPVPVRVPALGEWRGQDQRLFERGNHKQPAELVSRRFLEAIDPRPYSSSLSGRRELTDSVLADGNPLTRRVIVNRIWHHLFGQGLVSTPDNFGRLGAEPSHPELLSYLATRFSTEDQWSIKSLIRLIMTSQTWQRGSVPSEAVRRADPENRWLSYASVRRLEAEAIRDRLLRASGQLDAAMFGPPANGTSGRRSVYVSVIRNRLDPFLSTFDAPTPFGATGRRDVTNVPAQSLLLLNDPFVLRAARGAAGRLSSSDSQEQKITALWRQVLQRDPTQAEHEDAASLLTTLRDANRQQQERILQLDAQVENLTRQVDEILEPARRQLLQTSQEGGQTGPDLEPAVAWDFSKGATDLAGTLDARLMGTARVADGRLKLDGRGWLQTAALPGQLAAKSLEVRVVLSDSDQRAGGVMSVQTLDGQFFDAIVYAEQQPRRWLAGSNFFARTSSLEGPAEDSASGEPVHLVITWAMDGTITCYRNGQPYGKPYRKPIYKFAPQNSQILLGMRHGTNLSAGRMFRGEVLTARLYDRCLTSDQVRAAAQADGGYVSRKAVLASLSVEQRTLVERLLTNRDRATQQRAAVPAPPAAGQEWADLAHALFNLKEFIYVR
ncbi:MAG: DUF1553 domain-containing protein [Planctomycetaceae bacterium]|nr:DUF1553 domain-containing protein [Planctomycetaceae bacterium]